MICPNLLGGASVARLTAVPPPTPRYAQAMATGGHDFSELAAVWLSNEAPGVLPGIAESAAHGFLLVRDGAEPLAVTDSHGTWVDWLG